MKIKETGKNEAKKIMTFDTTVTVVGLPLRSRSHWDEYPLGISKHGRQAEVNGGLRRDRPTLVFST